MTDVWYIDADGQVEGPLTLGELRERAADGRLCSADSVSTDRMNWMSAREVMELTFPASTVVQTEPTPQARSPLLETVVSGRGDLDTAPATPPPFSPLDSVPGYDVQDTLGAGACGVVFRAVQVKLNRVVALKTVRMAEKTSADMVARFEQEAVSLARLQHPNIVAVYDCGHTNGRAYFAMELLDGEDLGARLDRAGPLDERTAWLIARQTAAALAHAATLGVIHRDVKPANLFLVPPPTGFPLPPGVPMVKVTDFGLALMRRGPGDADNRQTAAGVVLGTPVYMAPEQFSGSSVDPRADIYSLGATVYHILTGAPPFDGRTVWEVMMMKANPAPRLQPPISKETADLVDAMLRAKAGERPTDYADLISRIDALPCVAGAFSSAGLPAVTPLPPPTAAPVSAPAPPPRRRMGWVYAGAAMALLGLAVGIAAMAGAFNRPQEQGEPNTKVNPKPVNYKTGPQELLYVSGSLAGWVLVPGSPWEIAQDDNIEQTPILMGKGGVTRPLKPLANFRVILSLDPHEASMVEVIVAVAAGPPDSATQWLVRLDRAGGVAFGKRAGTQGAFEPVGAAVPVPTPKELADQIRRPYLEVSYERAGGTLAAFFRGQALGRTPDKGLTTTEFRVNAIGGPVRIDYAAIEELVEQK